MNCKIDARGLACPQPVVLAKNKMKECGTIEILADNETALENLKRLASSSGWTFENIIMDGYFKIILKAGSTQIAEASNEIITSCSGDNTIVIFSSDKMGSGNDDLGSILIKAFVHTLASLEPIPSKLVFYNSGVNLTADGSGVEDDLKVLNEKGVEILICGTCVNFYDIGSKIKTGTISNMYDILDSMNNASRTINP